MSRANLALVNARIGDTLLVTPALRANAAIHEDWGPGLASTQYDERFVPPAHKTGVTMGMGMAAVNAGVLFLDPTTASAVSETAQTAGAPAMSGRPSRKVRNSQ